MANFRTAAGSDSSRWWRASNRAWRDVKAWLKQSRTSSRTAADGVQMPTFDVSSWNMRQTRAMRLAIFRT